MVSKTPEVPAVSSVRTPHVKAEIGNEGTAMLNTRPLM